MKLSHEKIIHVSHVLVGALEKVEGVDLLRDRNEVRLEIVGILKGELAKETEIENRVRFKILSQKKDIPEGSQEWEILYRKYYEEEVGKLRESFD